MKKASESKDMDEFRDVIVLQLTLILPSLTLLQAFKIYSKASPEETFADIEKKMREENFAIYIIALVST